MVGGIGEAQLPIVRDILPIIEKMYADTARPGDHSSEAHAEGVQERVEAGCTVVKVDIDHSAPASVAGRSPQSGAVAAEGRLHERGQSRRLRSAGMDDSAADYEWIEVTDVAAFPARDGAGALVHDSSSARNTPHHP